jgi:hypothetical protein
MARPPGTGIGGRAREGDVSMRIRAYLVGLLLAALASATLIAQNGAPRGNGAPRRTASIAGRVLHPDGAAADGAHIAVYAVREGAPAAIAGTATSRYDGHYEVTGLPAGTFMVGVTPRKGGGFGGETKRPAGTAAESFYPGVADRDDALAVTVFEGVPAEGIDVWLSPAPQRFSISGRVGWPEDISVENVVIEYSGPEMRRGVWQVHDPGGLFTINGAAQGTYVLYARGETPAGPLLGIASTDVAVGPVEDVRIMLRPPGVIDGRLVIEGPAPPSSTIRLSPVQTLLTLSPLYPADDVTVGSDGRFELKHLIGEYTIRLHDLPPGWRIVRITRNGAALAGNRIVVAPGERVTGVEVLIGTGSTPGTAGAGSPR